jgi:histone deacetylase 6
MEDDITMEGLPLRNSEASTFDGAKASPLAGMNGNADPSLAPSLLESFQRPRPLPADLGQPPTSNARRDSLRPRTTTESPSSKSDDDSALDIASNADVDDVVPRGLPLTSLPTGLCYDVRMRYHCEVRPKTDIHPEDPRRIYYIFMELCRAGLVDDPAAQQPLVKMPLKRIDARDATEEEICLVHTPDLYAFVKSTKGRGLRCLSILYLVRLIMKIDMDDQELIELEEGKDSIYFCSLTWQSSILSVGGAIETCRAVVAREVKNAIAVIRPPGHHAEIDKTMGFCLFNNVCVAAKICQRDFGSKCRKILILDWDVHHGNGVQKVFYEDPNVLYISLHVFQNGSFYPGGPEGDFAYCGRGPGLGKNVNIPWPSQGMGDGDYIFAFQQVVMPIASEFDPDLVIISAGFDAASGDELGGCFVTPACYAHMTHMLMTLAEGKVAVCLEGGYNFRSISKSALAVTRTLMGEPPDRLMETSPTMVGIETVRQVVMRQSRYWRCMYPKESSEVGGDGDRMHDIIRQYQTKLLYDNYKMISLFIYRDQLSKSYENQVLATPKYDSDLPLLLIFHDPPEVSGIPHPTTNKLELHNTWLADSLKDYIHWSVAQEFSVIDVNIPKWITDAEEDGAYGEERYQNRIASTEELALYLWENYIEVNDASPIFLLGVGDAFHGLSSLLINRDSVYERVKGIVAFVAENQLRPVTSPTNVWLSKWYHKNSMVFVSPSHQVWMHDSYTKRGKPSKRYGTLIKSTRNSLNGMLKRHQKQVQEFLLEKAGRPSSEGMVDVAEQAGTFAPPHFT